MEGYIYSFCFFSQKCFSISEVLSDVFVCDCSRQPELLQKQTTGSVLGKFLHLFSFSCRQCFPLGMIKCLKFNIFVAVIQIFYVNEKHTHTCSYLKLWDWIILFADMKNIICSLLQNIFFFFFVAVDALEHRRSFSGATLLYPDYLDKFPHRIPNKWASESALQTTLLACIYYSNIIIKM